MFLLFKGARNLKSLDHRLNVQLIADFMIKICFPVFATFPGEQRVQKPRFSYYKIDSRNRVNETPLFLDMLSIFSEESVENMFN